MLAAGYVVTLYALAALGLILATIRSRRGWRAQMGVLASLAIVWALALGTLLLDDSVGHDCDQADHAGELPGMLAALGWAVLLLAAAAIPNPPMSRLTVRIGLPLATIAL